MLDRAAIEHPEPVDCLPTYDGAVSSCAEPPNPRRGPISRYEQVLDADVQRREAVSCGSNHSREARRPMDDLVIQAVMIQVLRGHDLVDPRHIAGGEHLDHLSYYRRWPDGISHAERLPSSTRRC